MVGWDFLQGWRLDISSVHKTESVSASVNISSASEPTAFNLVGP